MKLQHVDSKDGTRIAYETVGTGPTLVLVGGAFNDRSGRTSGTPLAALLASHFTVVAYDRRGRGDSADAPSYQTERELEDLTALIAASGGSAHVFGMSSGAILPLAAACAHLPIEKLALYQPPLVLDADRLEGLAILATRLEDATKRDARHEATTLFLTEVMQMPAPAVAQMQKSPYWPSLEALAHTLSYDVRLTLLGPGSFERAARLEAPVQLLRGDATPPWIRASVDALTNRLPNGHLRVLSGQSHDVDIQVLARELIEFFEG